MSKERFFLLLSILGTAVSTLVFQLLAMLSHSRKLMARFLQSIFGSLFFSVQLSAWLCEAWTRSERFAGLRRPGRNTPRLRCGFHL